MNLIVVNNAEVNELISRGQRVVTFEMVANVHNVPLHTVRSAYRRNEEFFSEEETWVIEGEELQQLISVGLLKTNQGGSARVFSEIGYYLLVKTMRDRTSWHVQRQMAKAYFKVSHAIDLPQPAIGAIEATIQKHNLLADFFGAPRSVMLVEAAKDFRAQGIDVGQYLLESPAMNDIPNEDIYLEPTELGKHFNLSPADMNKTLSGMGLQAKINGQWQATDAAQGMWINHQWTAGNKSGYNLKWNLAKVRALMERYTEQYSE